MLKFIDCNCMIGKRAVIIENTPVTKEELMSVMSSCNIVKSLVYHSMAREYHPQEGNMMLLEDINSNDIFIPQWVIMPHHTGEFYSPEILMRKMKEFDIKTVRVFPKDHDFSMGNHTCKNLFEFLNDYKIPLFISLTQLDFESVFKLCQNYPELPVVLCDLNFRSDRRLYPLLESCQNLYLETSGYKVHRGIELICNRFGSERLLFGTQLPNFSAFSAVSMIIYANISDEGKNMIAYQNILNLIEKVKL